MATSFSGGRSCSTLREPPTMVKQLVNFITCGCESRHLFCNLQSRAQTHAVLVIGFYELIGSPSNFLTHWAIQALFIDRVCVTNEHCCVRFVLIGGQLFCTLMMTCHHVWHMTSCCRDQHDEYHLWNRIVFTLLSLLCPTPVLMRFLLLKP